MLRTHKTLIAIATAAATLRNHLADPIMSFNRDPVDAAYVGHVKDIRESAHGAEGGGGGGCGCH